MNALKPHVKDVEPTAIPDFSDPVERARLHAALERGLADMRANRTIPAAVVLEQLRNKHPGR